MINLGISAEKLAKWLLMIEPRRKTPYYMSLDSIKDYTYTIQEKEIIKNNRKRIIVGNAHSAKKQIEQLAAAYQTDGIMLLPQIFGKENRMRAIELLSEVFN